MTRHFGSPHQGGNESEASNDQRNASPSQGSQAKRLGGMGFHRDVNDFHSSPLSNRAADGGIQQPGPLLGDAIHTPNSNIIQFPALTSLPDNSRASERELFIRDLVVICFVCVTAAWVGCLVGAGLYIGKLVVAYLSGGA